MSASDLQDLESFLPSDQFLDIPADFPYDLDSSFYSSAESIIGIESSNDQVMAGSPESILGGIRSWSFSSSGSSNGELSPPTTPFSAENDTRDPFYTVAGEVARLKLNNEGNKNSNYQDQKGLLGAARILNQDSVVKNQSFNDSSWQLNQNQLQDQARQDKVLKPDCSSVWGKEQQVKAAGWRVQPRPHNQQNRKKNQSRGRSGVGYDNGICMRPLGLPLSAWPPLKPNNKHHQPSNHSSAGTRAVSLNGSGHKRECVGTGVFLPRRYGNETSDHIKKSACTSVQLPVKGVDGLNLNLGNMNIKGNRQPHFKIDFSTDYEALMAKGNAHLAQQKENVHSDQCVLNQLPQEWIY